MNLTKIIHEKYLEQKPTAEYSRILYESIEKEKELRATLNDDQQLLLSQLLDKYQAMQLDDQTKLIKFTVSLLKELYD